MNYISNIEQPHMTTASFFRHNMYVQNISVISESSIHDGLEHKEFGSIFGSMNMAVRRKWNVESTDWLKSRHLKT